MKSEALKVRALEADSHVVDRVAGVTTRTFVGAPLDLARVGREPETHYGFVHRGRVEITSGKRTFPVFAGMYFSVPGDLGLAGEGAGFVVTKRADRGVFLLGGPVETSGRLRYIDGCTDSLLLPPCTRGDPCLNFLHVPPGIHQTPHTHPSLRVGLVTVGSGWCESRGRVHALEPGSLFEIPAGCEHRFRTEASELRIVAFHPDSDFGPSDEIHPMLNRTLLPERKKGGQPCADFTASSQRHS